MIQRLRPITTLQDVEDFGHQFPESHLLEAFVDELAINDRLGFVGGILQVLGRHVGRRLEDGDAVNPFRTAQRQGRQDRGAERDVSRRGFRGGNAGRGGGWRAVAHFGRLRPEADFVRVDHDGRAPVLVVGYRIAVIVFVIVVV